jgi:regulator of RNase E activity RraA
MSVGKRIYLQRHLPDKVIMEGFKTVPASNVADVMERNSAMNPRIHLVSSPKNQMMVGPALTVKLRAGDNLALHAALNICTEGDVLVVSNEGEHGRALIGEVMMAYLMCTKKVAGIILADPDGVVVIPRRDAAVILADAKKFQAADEEKLEKSKNGTANREWVTKTLQEKGFEFIDSTCDM